MDDRKKNRVYIAIDLKSFFASVECVERHLNPLTTNLVVADLERTEKTICLAVSPSLKAHGISGRARLFEVVQKVKEANALRRGCFKEQDFLDKSYDDRELKANNRLAIDYIVAAPRMAIYMKYSTMIYNIYLKYIAPEDIHVYSIDEVFMDVTDYLKVYDMTPHQLAMKMIRHVLIDTGITATAGIGTNLYLCKIAMDIVAKHMEPDEDGVRVAELDELTYRKLLWNHKPITDFWRVGKGMAKRLAEVGIYTMGQIARCSMGNEDDFYNENLLFKLFGINAELLIDHAWGYEPCRIKDIKAYRPSDNSLCSGQVLQEPYTVDKARIVLQEMVEGLMLNLVEKNLTTNQIVVTIGYDIESLTGNKGEEYRGEIAVDHYGRRVPKAAHGTANIERFTASTKLATESVLKLFDDIIDPKLLIRKLNIAANHLKQEEKVSGEQGQQYMQLSLFDHNDFVDVNQTREVADYKAMEREKNMQKAVLDIKNKYGKNAIIRGINLREGATALERNRQIGGHKA